MFNINFVLGFLHSVVVAVLQHFAMFIVKLSRLVSFYVRVSFCVNQKWRMGGIEWNLCFV